MHLLVTGAAGFIGANFVHYWTAHHPDDRVVALDALTYADNPANLVEVRGRVSFVEADIGGPHQFPEKVIPLFTTLALDGQPLPVYASSANRREWLHVFDHCAAIERVLLDGRDGQTYNVGSGVEVSVADLATRILDRLGRPRTLAHTAPDRPGHDRRYLLDCTRLRKLGWGPTVDFEHGLADTITWYAEHRHWWQPLRARAAIDEKGWAG